ncbi:MAG: hypothetical protein D8M58_03675 [Calditrichaeota bacterium]|nr:MAG: hypothetical protein DWQ03_03400 [Calditrichota bacterium]MBL1204466.1 hypothetical protein [Calditrichota bacterium]NOG44295.1 hypothetical protein [Calditrichota bacterium]
MSKILKIIISFNFLFLSTTIFAQNKQSKTAVAVLDFDGDGISKQALVSLTNQFRGNLVEINSFTVLDRGKMDDILKEQGFQFSGCSSNECAVEAGKILNVQKMVAGNIGKVGDTYTINIFLIDVESSRIDKSSNRTYKGKVDGLLRIFKEISYTMSGKKIKQVTKAPLYIFGTSALVSVGFGTYSYFAGQSSYKKYKDAKTFNSMSGYKSDTKKFNNYILYSSIAVGTSALLYFISDGIFNSDREMNTVSASLYKSNFDTYNFALSIEF